MVKCKRGEFFVCKVCGHKTKNEESMKNHLKDVYEKVERQF